MTCLRPRTIQSRRLVVHAAALTVLVAAAVMSAPAPAQAQATRGPYLQNSSATAITVRWRTAAATNSRVRYGTTQGSLTSIGGQRHRHHRARGAGDRPCAPTPATTIRSGRPPPRRPATTPTTSSSPPRPPAPPRPTRIWVLGDAGTGSASQAAVRDAYYNFTGSRHTDLWLMLGDNAYSSSTDSEMQSKLFNVYPTMLRKSAVWATRGNHESATNGSGVPWHYVAWTQPTAAEAGGVASGTEAYFSFNYGNIHFISLDSFGSSRSSTGADGQLAAQRPGGQHRHLDHRLLPPPALLEGLAQLRHRDRSWSRCGTTSCPSWKTAASIWC